MNTIPPYSNTSYYSMPEQSSSPGADFLQSSSTAESLAQILSNNTANDPYDTVTLSPEAQNFLSGLSSVNTGASTSNPLLALLSGSTSGVGTGADSSNFTLTNSQQQQITAILGQYANAPFTQTTFNEIQSALQSAGLGPNQLAAQDEITSFNPTWDLLNDLNGNQANNTLNQSNPTNVAASEPTKSTNYINQIYQQWASISTTANSASTSTSQAVAAASSTAGA